MEHALRGPRPVVTFSPGSETQRAESLVLRAAGQLCYMALPCRHLHNPALASLCVVAKRDEASIIRTSLHNVYLLRLDFGALARRWPWALQCFLSACESRVFGLLYLLRPTRAKFAKLFCKARTASGELKSCAPVKELCILCPNSYYSSYSYSYYDDDDDYYIVLRSPPAKLPTTGAGGIRGPPW